MQLLTIAVRPILGGYPSRWLSIHMSAHSPHLVTLGHGRIQKVNVQYTKEPVHVCDDPAPSTRTITLLVAYLLIVGICKVKHQVVLVWSRCGSIKQHGCLLRPTLTVLDILKSIVAVYIYICTCILQADAFINPLSLHLVVHVYIILLSCIFTALTPASLALCR